MIIIIMIVISISLVIRFVLLKSLLFVLVPVWTMCTRCVLATR